MTIRYLPVPRATPRERPGDPRPDGRLFDLTEFARRSGVHPELIGRLVRLGLVRATPGPGGVLWFRPDQLPAIARIQRLRAGLSLNYAAIGLVVELLDRIRELEAAQHGRQRPGAAHGGAHGTDTGRSARWT